MNDGVPRPRKEACYYRMSLPCSSHRAGTVPMWPSSSSWPSFRLIFPQNSLQVALSFFASLVLSAERRAEQPRLAQSKQLVLLRCVIPDAPLPGSPPNLRSSLGDSKDGHQAQCNPVVDSSVAIAARKQRKPVGSG
ncbi:hypothetical protein FALCPG4_012037 [Fusarium falciforme]